MSSALMLHNISVVDPGREIREDPLERRRGEDFLVVLLLEILLEEEREYGRWSRLDRPSRRKLAVQLARM